MGALLYRGMLVGLVAGLIAFGFARLYGEPYVDLAIAFEESHEAAEESHEPVAEAHNDHSHGEQKAQAGHSHGGEEEIVSRDTQAGWGLLTALVVYGAGIGGIFSCVCSYAFGRIGKLNVMATSLLLAATAFVSVVLVPQLKYPSNPPAVGSPETIVSRTEDYFALILISLLAMVLVYIAAHQLKNRFGGLNAAIFAMIGYTIFMGIVYFIMPVINEVPVDFSADVLWHFRIATLGIQAILWAILGLGFGNLAAKRLKSLS